MRCITDENGPRLDFRKSSMLVPRGNLGNAIYRKGIDIGDWAFAARQSKATSYRYTSMMLDGLLCW
jgi:hypothetical protein